MAENITDLEKRQVGDNDKPRIIVSQLLYSFIATKNQGKEKILPWKSRFELGKSPNKSWELN